MSIDLKSDVFELVLDRITNTCRGGSEGVALLLCGCGAGISIGGFGGTSWHDGSRGGVCCAKG